MTMELLRPASTEPIRKMTIAAWKKIFRPYWSPSLPHSGVDTVEASRYAVMTQAMCEPPLRSPTIVGSAVDTIVWSSAASSMPQHERADDEQDAPAAEPRQPALCGVVRPGEPRAFGGRGRS